MERADETRLPRIVTQGGADLGHEQRKVAFGHEDAVPEPVVQFHLRQGARVVFDKGAQELERLGREMDLGLALAADVVTGFSRTHTVASCLSPTHVLAFGFSRTTTQQPARIDGQHEFAELKIHVTLRKFRR